MTDPVLQSFCERCGTRYTFAEPEVKPPPEEPKGKRGLFGKRPAHGGAPPATPEASTASPSFWAKA